MEQKCKAGSGERNLPLAERLTLVYALVLAKALHVALGDSNPHYPLHVAFALHTQPSWICEPSSRGSNEGTGDALAYIFYTCMG